MLSKIKKSYRIIIAIFLFVLLLILLCYGYFLMKDYTINKNKIEDKDNELVFKNYIYKLPKGWKKNDNKEHSEILNLYYSKNSDGISNHMGAIITLEKISSTGHKKDEIFKDITFFEENLKKGNIDIEDGKIIHNNNTSVIIFPSSYGESSKFILAYMPAYDDYFYDIQFYSNVIINGKEGMYYNYDGLNTIINFLNSGVKNNH